MEKLNNPHNRDSTGTACVLYDFRNENESPEKFAVMADRTGNMLKELVRLEVSPSIIQDIVCIITKFRPIERKALSLSKLFVKSIVEIFELCICNDNKLAVTYVFMKLLSHLLSLSCAVKSTAEVSSKNSDMFISTLKTLDLHNTLFEKLAEIMNQFEKDEIKIERMQVL